MQQLMLLKAAIVLRAVRGDSKGLIYQTREINLAIRSRGIKDTLDLKHFRQVFYASLFFS